FQSNAGIMAGMSGGPDVNLAGDVVAISTWARSGAESIKFLVPVNVAKSFLAEAQVPINVDSDFSKHYRAALDAGHTADWTAPAAELAMASKLFPNSPDVIRLTNEFDHRLTEMPLL